MPDARASFADAVLELCLGAVLIAVPLFVVPYSALPFEEAKVSLLRSTAFICLPFILAALARIRLEYSRLSSPESKRLLAISGLVLLFGYLHLVSTFFGLSPIDSFFGTQIRRQGTYTALSYLLFFYAVIAIIRTHKQMDRLLLAIQLAGFVVSFWAIAQFLGIDPNLFHGFAKPTWSTFGNRLFLPAFLIMCIPVNLYFAMRTFMTVKSIDKANTPTKTQFRLKLFLGMCLVFLALNGFVIIMAQKRGPLLGLIVALLLFLILYLLGHGRIKLTLGLLFTSGLLALPLVFISLSGQLLAMLSHLPLLDKLANSFQAGTGLVRVYIWKGIIKLLASNPGRMLTGYGAESVSVATPMHMSPILKQIEKPTAIADRAHNEILDMIVMHGVLGTTVFLTIFAALGYTALNQLGLFQSKSHKAAWPICLIGGMLSGFLLAYFATGETTFSGMGIGLGMVAGFFIYLLYFLATNPKRYSTCWDAKTLLMSLLLSSLVAHFVEIQFSFGITATRLYYWIIGGLIVVGGCFWKKPKLLDPNIDRKRSFQLPSATYTTILGCIACISISFAYLCFGKHYDVYIYSVLVCQLSIMFVCYLSFQPRVEPIRGRQYRLQLQNAIPVLALIGTTLFYFLAIYIAEPVVTAIQKSFSPETLAAVVSKNVKLIITYTGIIIVILTGALFCMHQRGVQMKTQRRTIWLVIFMIVLLIPPVIRSNLYYSMADIYTKAGDDLLNSGYWQQAHQCYRSAITFEPRQAWRHQKLGHLFLKRAKSATEPQKTRLYQEAIIQANASTQLAPLDVTLKNNLARMSSAWVEDSPDEKQRFHRLKLTEAFYDKALVADPNNTLLWKEAGQISAALGLLEKAVKQFTRALQQQPTDFESHRNLALLYQAQERYAPALDHARSALRLAPKTEIYKIQALILKLQKQIQE